MNTARALRVLGFCHEASVPSHATIKQAYMRAAIATHPDKGGDKAAFQEVNAAYEHLRALAPPPPPQEQPQDKQQPQEGFFFHAAGGGERIRAAHKFVCGKPASHVIVMVGMWSFATTACTSGFELSLAFDGNQYAGGALAVPPPPSTSAMPGASRSVRDGNVTALYRWTRGMGWQLEHVSIILDVNNAHAAIRMYRAHEMGSGCGAS